MLHHALSIGLWWLHTFSVWFGLLKAVADLLGIWRGRLRVGLVWRIVKVARLLEQCHFALNSIESLLDDFSLAEPFPLLWLTIVVQEDVLLQFVTH